MSADRDFAWICFKKYYGGWEAADTAMSVYDVSGLETVMNSAELEAFFDEPEEGDLDEACEKLFKEKSLTWVSDTSNEKVLVIGSVSQLLRAMESAKKDQTAITVD